MKNRLYSILDSVAQDFSAPFISRTDASAVRNYRDFVSKLPENCDKRDFLLYFIGFFDSDKGFIAAPDGGSVYIVDTAPYGGQLDET